MRADDIDQTAMYQATSAVCSYTHNHVLIAKKKEAAQLHCGAQLHTRIMQLLLGLRLVLSEARASRGTAQRKAC
jgi:hypothetical protein